MTEWAGALHPAIIYPAVFVTGTLVSYINSWAGGGSTLSLPIFFFFGIPATIAHGTNRFGLIWGNLASVLSLRKAGHFNLSKSLRYIIPMGIGAIGGTYIAIDIPEKLFNTLIAIVIVGITFFSNLKPAAPGEEKKATVQHPIIRYGIYFLAGLYGGFIQVGTGFIMIFIFSRLEGKNAYQTNALKGFYANLILLISFCIFASQGYVNWGLAITFGAGCWIGGHLGGRQQVKKDVQWIKWVVRCMGLIMAIKLLGSSFG